MDYFLFFTIGVGTGVIVQRFFWGMSDIFKSVAADEYDKGDNNAK